jgi:hypothetical protein
MINSTNTVMMAMVMSRFVAILHDRASAITDQPGNHNLFDQGFRELGNHTPVREGTGMIYARNGLGVRVREVVKVQNECIKAVVQGMEIGWWNRTKGRRLTSLPFLSGS